jgi:hypothetical protein
MDAKEFIETASRNFELLTQRTLDTLTANHCHTAAVLDDFISSATGLIEYPLAVAAMGAFDDSGRSLVCHTKVCNGRVPANMELLVRTAYITALLVRS